MAKRTTNLRRTSIWLAALTLCVAGSVMAPSTARANADPIARADAVSRDLLAPWVARYERTSKNAASRLQGKQPDFYAARVFLLERELVDMLQHVNGRKDLNRVERRLVSADIRNWFGRLQHSYTTIQKTMVAQSKANGQSTGFTRVERRKVKGDGVDVYLPTYQTDTPLSKGERSKRYKAIVAKRQAKHPGLAPHMPINAMTLKTIPSGELREGATTQGGHVRMTSFAKHADVAGGKGAQSSYGFKVFWGKRGKKKVPLLVVLSNWSGTYQPDMASLAPTVARRLRKLGIPDAVVVHSANEAVSPKMFEILARGRGIDKSMAKGRGARLIRFADKRAQKLNHSWNRAITKHTGGQALKAQQNSRFGARARYQARRWAPRPR